MIAMRQFCIEWSTLAANRNAPANPLRTGAATRHHIIDALRIFPRGVLRHDALHLRKLSRHTMRFARHDLSPALAESLSPEPTSLILSHLAAPERTAETRRGS